MTGLSFSSDNSAGLYVSTFVIIILIYLFARPILRSGNLAQQHANAIAVIRDLLPDLQLNPDTAIPRNGNPFWNLLILVLIVMLLFNQPVIAFFQTDFPAINVSLSMLLWAVLLIAAKRIFDRVRNPGRPFARTLQQELVTGLFFTGYVILVEWAYNALIAWLPVLSGGDSSQTSLILAGFAILVILIIPYFWVRFGRRRGIRFQALIKAANYDQVQSEIGDLRERSPKAPGYLYIQATPLMFKGDFDEAAVHLREALSLGINGPPTFLALVLSTLASCADEQAHYVEALRLYNGALTIQPNFMAALIGKSETLLTQNIQVQEAFTILGEAYNIQARNISANRTMWSFILVQQAWALTLLNKPDGLRLVDPLIQQALAETDLQYKAGLATLHYRIGYIRALRRQKTLAAQHFNQAMEIDPVNYIARKASDALAKL